MNDRRATSTTKSLDYASKHPNYFSGVRADYLHLLKEGSAAHVLEIGCGTGDLGARALQEGRCAHYCAVELDPAAATNARKQLTEVVAGDIESLELSWGPETFDVLIASEVLEHLIDPRETLKKLHPLLKPGAIVMASSPNVSHYRVITSLLRGRWDLTEAGVMDRTHLRWFTPKTYAEMFRSAGYEIQSIGPVAKYGAKAKFINWATGGKLDHLLMTQINVIAIKQ